MISRITEDNSKLNCWFYVVHTRLSIGGQLFMLDGHWWGYRGGSLTAIQAWRPLCGSRPLVTP